jgi:hypothetical protein
MARMIRSVVAVAVFLLYITPSIVGFVVCSRRRKPIGRVAESFESRKYTRPSNYGRTIPAAIMSTRVDDATRDEMRAELMELIGNTPRNAPTSKRTTDEILSTVIRLEDSCPTAEEDVLNSLGGAWELLWTAQVGYIMPLPMCSSIYIKNLIRNCDSCSGPVKCGIEQRPKPFHLDKVSGK